MSGEVAFIRKEDTTLGGFRRLLLVDREGRERAQVDEPGDYFAPRLSPDGLALSASTIDRNPQLWSSSSRTPVPATPDTTGIELCAGQCAAYFNEHAAETRVA